MDIKGLRKFLIYCGKEGYATIEDEIKEPDGSHSIVLNQGSWKFHDNFFGGEPYGGREVVFYKDKPVWIMTYYGRVDYSIQNIKPIYQHLKKALALIPEDAPYRGPKEFSENNLQYVNHWTGDIDGFSGEEIILLSGNEVYRAQYVGGLVDQI